MGLPIGVIAVELVPSREKVDVAAPGSPQLEHVRVFPWERRFVRLDALSRMASERIAQIGRFLRLRNDLKPK